MAARRGRYAEATAGLLRLTVLDTVGGLVVDHGWDGLSMARIAAEAGVSRQTLYNEFGDRDGLLEAYVIREAGRFLDGVEEAILAHGDDLEAAFIIAFQSVMRSADAHPVIQAVVTGEMSSTVLEPLVAAPGRPIIDLATGRLASILSARWPAVDPADVEAVCELLVRLAISYLTQGNHDIDDATDKMRRVFSPFFHAATDS